MLEYDDMIIGYKDNVIKKIRENLAEMIQNNEIENEEIGEIGKLLKDIEENALGHKLIIFKEHIMGGYYWTYADIREDEDEELHFAE